MLFVTFLASRTVPSQLTFMRLSAHTHASTICAPSSSSEPGKGILEHTSASTIHGLLLTRSKLRTANPFGARARARAASPHPRSAITTVEDAEDEENWDT